MLVRCNTDLGAELFRSSYLTLSVHDYGCTEETSNGTDADADLDLDVGLDCDDCDAWDAMDSASDISDCSPSVPLTPPFSSCILFRAGGDFLVFNASVFWPFPLLLVGCCPFLSQFFSSPSLFLTTFGFLIIKNVKSESCGYNLLNAVHRHERTVYILAEISGRVTAEFRRVPVKHRPVSLTLVSHRYYTF